MPTYEYLCGGCSSVDTRRRVPEDRWLPAKCGVCGGQMAPIYSAPTVRNSTASSGTLESFGRDLRVTPGTRTLAQKIRECEEARADE